MGVLAPIVLNEEFNGSVTFALLTYFKKVALVNQSPLFKFRGALRLTGDPEPLRNEPDLLLKQGNNVIEGPAPAELFCTDKDFEFRFFLEQYNGERSQALTELREELVPVQEP